MRLIALVVVVVVLCGQATADHRAMRERREHLLARAALQAFEKAKTMPPISEKAFAVVWRKEYDRWLAATCRCPFRATKLAGEPNACVIEALDAFNLELMLPSFRLPGMSDVMQDDSLSRAEVEARAQKAVEDALDAVVPAKEQLRRQSEMKKCFERVGVM